VDERKGAGATCINHECQARVLILFSDSQMIIVKSNTEGYARARPGWNSGASPVIGVFTGLPLIAVAVLLTDLHKKVFGAKDQKIFLKCLSCGHLNVEKTKYCGDCGKPLLAEGQHPAPDR
jgi:hypothetical protein